jgi:hypothetical protein
VSIDKQRATRWVAFGVVFVVAATSCSGGRSASLPTRAATTVPVTSDVPVTAAPTTASTVAVAPTVTDAPPTTVVTPNVATVTLMSGQAMHVALEGLATIDAPASSLSGSGTVEVNQVIASQTDPAVTPAGAGVHLNFTGVTVSGPVTLSFPAAPAQNIQAQAVLVHLTDDGREELLPATYANNTISGTTSSFSSIIPAWLNPADWVKSLWGALYHGATGRSANFSCTGRAPEWGTVIAPALDLVHVCAINNPAPNGAARYEVQIKSNRGTYLNVNVPDGTDYVWVEDEPDLLRKALLIGGDWRHNIVLRPDATMTIGYSRPPTNGNYTLEVGFNNWTMADTIVLRLLDVAAGAAGEKWAGAWVGFFLAECGAGLDLGGANIGQTSMFEFFKCVMLKMFDSGNYDRLVAYFNKLGGSIAAKALAKTGILAKIWGEVSWVVGFLQAGWGTFSDELAQIMYGSTAVQVGLIAAPSPQPPVTPPATPAPTPVTPATTPVTPATTPVTPATTPGTLSTNPGTLSTNPATQATTPVTQATTPVTQATAPNTPPGTLSVRLDENPFICDSTSHHLGMISGAQPGERIAFTSSTVPGLLPGTADGNGNLGLIWQCDPTQNGQSWSVNATSASGRTGSFTVTGGAAPQPAPTCTPWGGYAQGQWSPSGAALRDAPAGNKIGGFPASTPLTFDRWTTAGSPLYPGNPAPYNSNQWLHLANGSGWVSFPGVRADQEAYDPASGPGAAVPLPDACRG